MADIVWDPAAVRQLRKIKNEAERVQVFEKVQRLSVWPIEQIDVRPVANSTAHRLRVGRYRVIFSVSPGSPTTIEIHAVRKRDERTYKN